MATVVGLYIYPVKSARGIALESARLGTVGFEWDRHWMLVDAKGTFLTQRTHPQLARLVPKIAPDSLVLSAPDLPLLQLPLEAVGNPIAVRVWDCHGTGLDQGDPAAHWASQVAGQPVRLVRVPDSLPRLANPKYAGDAPAPVAFPDGFPILVCNEASLEELNSQLPESIPMERFRPNLVLRGLPAYAEDHIDSLTIGAVTLRLVKPCTRCVIPSLDHITGERSTDPTPVLRKFRFDRALRGVTFGENAVIATGSGTMIAQGADCVVTYDRSGAH